MRQVLVAGGGLAGLRTIEALRAGGYDGRLLLVGAESALPYDRPPLSKEVLRGERSVESATMRSAEQFAALQVELLLGQPAHALDLAQRTVSVGGRRLAFDGLVIATGAQARELAQGHELDGVHVLRTADDARAVAAALTRRPRVLVVGGGFIGGEVAASAKALGLDVTMVEASSTPLTRAVGPTMGAVYAQLHRDHGTVVRLGVSVARLEGAGRVERAVLSDGTTVDVDLVVAGVGAMPSTAWLETSGLTIRDGVVCDATLATGAPGVFAVGDIARWPNPLFGLQQRCEQWTNAAEQGRHVARNLLAGPDNATPFIGANTFWSDQYGMRLQFVGVAEADEVRVVAGDPSAYRFIAYYRRGDRLVGAFAMNAVKPLITAKRLVERRASWSEAVAQTAPFAIASGEPA